MMAKNYPLIIVVFTLLAGCQVQKTVTPKNQEPLFTIDQSPVLAEDFKYAFLKNYRPSDSMTVEQEVKEYLDLYVNFKLKVQEARSLGYAERKSYQDELTKYQKDLAKPYLMESQVTEELVRETYERLKYEVKASHILIQASQNSSPEDTLEAYNKILDIKEIAETGLPFDSLAKAHSGDPSAQVNGGNLGYFTALQMVYPFETAAFDTPVGSVSEPVKTRFGYHLIKVDDKRPARGKVRVAHLMLRTPKNQKPQDAKKVQDKIDAIYKVLLEGKEWRNIVAEYSEDPSTKDKGGELPWFGTGNFVPEFEEVAFSLDSVKSLSEPFKTVYGWHIIKFLEKKELESFEVVKPEIEKRISRDSRSQAKVQVVIDRLKQENGFGEYQDAIDKICADLDSTTYTENQANDILFTIGSQNFTAANFKAFYDNSTSNNKSASDLYNQFERESILNFENDLLESKYPEYRSLLNEYREGILLFDIMEELVWQKASRDTTGLKGFYENKKVYYTKENASKGVIYSSRSKEVVLQVEKEINDGKSVGSIEDQFNKDNPLNLQVSEGSFVKGDNRFVDQDPTPGLRVYEDNGRTYLIHITSIEESVIPKLEEIKGKVISDYQEYLENTWIKDLKSKYNVVVNEKKLELVISEIENSI